MNVMVLTDDKLTLVHVLAWCCKVTSHYLNQCWPISMSSFDVNRPQWVNLCAVEFRSGNANIYMYFLSFLNTQMAQVVEIIPYGRQGPIYPPLSTLWLLMDWVMLHLRILWFSSVGKIMRNLLSPRDFMKHDNHWFMLWPVICFGGSHYLNQCWNSQN